MLYLSGWRTTHGVSRLAGLGLIVAIGCVSFKLYAQSVGDAPAIDSSSVEQAGAESAAGVQAGSHLSEAQRFRPRWVAPSRALERSKDLPVADSGARATAAVSDMAEASERRFSSWPADVRVVIHALGPSSQATTDVERALRARGVERLESRRVAKSPAANQVRYFHEADADHAEELASEMSAILGTVDILKLTFYRPKPAPGLLELWLP